MGLEKGKLNYLESRSVLYTRDSGSTFNNQASSFKFEVDVMRDRCNRRITQTVSSGKLVQEGQSDLGKFERVTPAESADRGGIAGCVDPGVVVPGDSLIKHGSGEAILVPAGVVRAGVTAGRVIGNGQLAVCADQRLCEGVCPAVDVVSLDGDNLGGSRLEAVKGQMISVCSLMRLESGENVLGRHVEFHESLDGSSSSRIVGGDGQGAEETGFLTGVEVDLDRGGGFKARGN